MNLKDQVRDALAGITPFHQGAHMLEAGADGARARCELVSLDRLACAFERLTVQLDVLSGAPVEKLKQTAQRLSAQLTYLLEPISPIEVDAHGCSVQMRSNPPQKEADTTTYYELLVECTGELSLCRYSRVAKGDRTRIPAEVTREVLLRLVGDFSNAAV